MIQLSTGTESAQNLVDGYTRQNDPITSPASPAIIKVAYRIFLTYLTSPASRTITVKIESLDSNVLYSEFDTVITSSDSNLPCCVTTPFVFAQNDWGIGITITSDNASDTSVTVEITGLTDDIEYYLAYRAAESSPTADSVIERVKATDDTVGHADYGNAKLVRATTPANTLDVSATGEAGLDFANIKDATGAHTLTNITVPTVTTVTNQLTAAAIATGVWQDTTAGDFTTAGSIGKSLFTSGAVPGDTGGLFIAGTNAPVTITGSGTALTLTSTGGNGSGISASGNGSGKGLLVTGGATGSGLEAQGGASGGFGIYAQANGAEYDGIYAEGYTTGSGMLLTGGATGHGLRCTGGSTSGDGIYAAGQTLGHGMTLVFAGAERYDLNADVHGTIDAATTVGSVTTKTGYELADDAITAAKFDESTAFPLKSADTDATAVARTGADSDTLKTLSDEIAGITVTIDQDDIDAIVSGLVSGGMPSADAVEQILSVVAGNMTYNPTTGVVSFKDTSDGTTERATYTVSSTSVGRTSASVS